MILMIPIAFGLSSLCLYFAFYQDSPHSFSKCFLAAFVAQLLFIAVATELLNLFHLVNEMGIGIAWLSFNLSLLAAFYFLRNSGKSTLEILKTWYVTVVRFFRQLGTFTSLIILSLLATTFIVAIVAPPNNIDSLCYHLSRIGYWTQNQSIEHYPSHIERAISFAPLSEYAHLHTFLLTGNEQFFQLVQWLSLVGILAVTILTVRLFSLSLPALRFALCFAATLPIVVLESMTTQNDLVVTFFVVSAVYYILNYLKNGEFSDLFLLTIIIALGILAKVTFLLYVCPFGLYLIFKLIQRKEWRIIIRSSAGALLISVLLNSPFFLRTFDIFGTPFGNISKGNRSHVGNLPEFISSVARQVFLHLGFISPGDVYNHFLLRQLHLLHDWLGVDMYDPKLGMTFKMNRLNFNEDFAHNFLGIWMILVALIMLPFLKLSSPIKKYSFLSLMSFLTFCLFIGYQIYGSRLHIPFFMLMSPAIGVIYGSFSGLLQKILLGIMWLSALPFATLSMTHPLISTKWFFENVFPAINKSLNLNIKADNLMNLKHESVLFSSPEQIVWGDELPNVQAVVNFADSIQANDIGFDFKESSHDYAYQYVLRNDRRHFAHIMIQNPSKVLENPDFVPDCIIAERDEGDHFLYHDRIFYKKLTVPGRWVYAPKS